MYAVSFILGHLRTWKHLKTHYLLFSEKHRFIFAFSANESLRGLFSSSQHNGKALNTTIHHHAGGRIDVDDIPTDLCVSCLPACADRNRPVHRSISQSLRFFFPSIKQSDSVLFRFTDTAWSIFTSDSFITYIMISTYAQTRLDHERHFVYSITDTCTSSHYIRTYNVLRHRQTVDFNTSNDQNDKNAIEKKIWSWSRKMYKKKKKRREEVDLIQCEKLSDIDNHLN